MIVVEYKSIELDYCPSCKGVWFDSGELELMFRTSGVDTKSIVDIRHLPAAKTNEKIRRCPICREGMTKNDIGQKPPVLIDVCPRGDGLFFDGGEVAELIKQLPQTKSGKSHPVVEFLGEVIKK
jgi:Zn-finger nucleic acid-binding protein